MWEYIKSIVISISSALIAYLYPVAGNLQSLLGLFFINFIVGYLTGMIKNNEHFQMKKCMMCFVWAAVILSLICFFYFLGERNGNKEQTLEFVRWVSLIAIWAFGCNILRNLRHLSYGMGAYYTFFDALYSGVSLEFLKKLPFLKQLTNNPYIPNIKPDNQNEDKQRDNRTDQGI